MIRPEDQPEPTDVSAMKWEDDTYRSSIFSQLHPYSVAHKLSK